jgi:hypothetical protein
VKLSTFLQREAVYLGTRLAATALAMAILGECGAAWAIARDRPDTEPFDPRPLFESMKAAYSGGPFSFAVIGECKNECSTGGAEIAEYLDHHHPDVAFAVTMGDMLHYKGPEQDWDELAKNIGWFMRRYATFPVMGDQERIGRPESRFYEFYGLSRSKRSENATWTLGDAVFLTLGYYDPPNLGGANNGRYTTPQATVHDLERNSLTTVEEVLRNATDQGQRIFTFSHAQYAGGDKYYCCYRGETRELFENSAIAVHFQADNPGFTASREDGIWYIRASGASKFDPPFLALVTVRAASIIIEFPDTRGGTQAPSVSIP